MRRLLSMIAFSLLLAPIALPDDSKSVQETVAALGGTFELGPGGLSAPLVKVDLHGTAVTDADLVFLASLPELTSLDLRLTKVTDAALAHVKSLRRLQFLNLFRTRITDAGLEKLTNLMQLETLL